MKLSLKIVFSVLAIAFAFAPAVYAADEAAGEAKAAKTYPGFDNDSEIVSYVFGTFIGRDVKSRFENADTKKFVSGLQDHVAGKDLDIPEEDFQTIMEVYMGRLQAKMAGQDAPETDPIKDYPGFDNDDQKASYILGVTVADQLKSIPFELASQMVADGFTDSFSGKELAIPEADHQDIMASFQAKMMAKMQQEKEEKLAAAGWKTKLEKPEMMTFDKAKDYFWILETNKGKIKVKLMPEVAPMHVSSTIFLTKKGFYNDLSFHRVIPGFMAQGGCPLGDGTGGPGYEYEGEFSDTVKHDKPYLLSMANAGPGTDGSQFFLTFKPTPWLDGKHTIFGEVVDGQDVVKNLEKFGTQSGKPTTELKIVKATIEEAAKN